MNKIWQVAIVVFIVGVLYLIMLAVMPVVVDITSVANITAASVPGRNVTADYPGSTEFLLASPWILWFVPGVIGMIVVVVILKTK